MAFKGHLQLYGFYDSESCMKAFNKDCLKTATKQEGSRDNVQSLQNSYPELTFSTEKEDGSQGIMTSVEVI